MSKGGGKTVQTVQDTSPWKDQQPYLKDLFTRAQGLYNQNPSGTSPLTSRFQGLITDRALGGSPLTSAANAELMKTMQGGYSNPYAARALGDAMDMARSKINAQFSGDNYGSSAHKEWLGRGITQASLPFASQLFENERGRQMGAAGMAPGLANQDFADLGQGLDASRMMDASPWEALQRYQSAVGANYGSSSVGTQPYTKSNPLADILGLGIGGAGLWKLATGAPIFSDRRLKRDIELVSTHPSGVSLYSFKYLHDDTPRIGVMADEVEKVKPEAVGERDGFKTVDYSKLEE